MNPSLRDDAAQLAPQLTRWRRHLHANPELSGCEEQTARYIAANLRELGYEPRERVGDSFGVIAEAPCGDADTPWIVLRADTDALPITEESDLEYVSKNTGVMHACGHDAHTAMLLGAAQLLRDHRTKLRRNVRLVFQPHEERYPGGAPSMIAGGALADAEAVFGIHICSNLPSGQVGTRPGPFMAAVNTLRIRVVGKGGHAAMPSESVDPIVAAAHIITALQTVVSRRLPVAEPAVVSITQINAGTADNVIPGEVEMAGTIRTFSADVRRKAAEEVTRIAEQVAAAHHADAIVDVQPGYPALINDADVTETARQAARELGVAEDDLPILEPQGGGEDFSYYCEQAPAAFVFVGARNAEKDCVYPHHHPRFNIDEAAMPLGTALYAAMALRD